MNQPAPQAAGEDQGNLQTSFLELEAIDISNLDGHGEDGQTATAGDVLRDSLHLQAQELARVPVPEDHLQLHGIPLFEILPVSLPPFGSERNAHGQGHRC